MNCGLIILAFCVWISYSINACGYEQATHARITQFALGASLLSSGSFGELAPLVRSLGLDAYAPLGTEDDYLELTQRFGSGQPVQHKAEVYELKMMGALRVPMEADPIRTWLMFGAIREDDNLSEDPPTPRDFYPPLNRPLSHFYDPYNNTKLNAWFLNPLDPDINRAPDWAMGTADIFTGPNTPLTPRYNTFTVFDAREAMFRALTLKSYDGSGFTDIAGSTDPARRQELRRMYWATTFRALGDVLHVNQDMAQPQHTRNEPHAGKLCSWIPGCPGGHSSVYEKYMNARALNAAAFDLAEPYDTSISIWPLAIVAGAYPIPAFHTYADYWSTATGAASLTGKGLANYSNQGFFSAAKNFGSSDYPSPSSRITDYSVRTMQARRWDGVLVGGTTPTYVFFGPVRDAWEGSVATDVPLTTFGLWDQFLKDGGKLPRYTLNRFNYDAMANLLVPRAVAYSAGLINYFFRGVLEITPPDEGVFAIADHADPKGFTKIRAKVTNRTANFTSPDGVPGVQSMDNGDLFAVVRYHKDVKYAADLSTVVGVAPCAEPLAVVVEKNLDATTECRDGVEQMIVSPPISGVSIGPGGDQLVEFDFSDTPIPFGVTDVRLQVVYRGPLGNETRAVAVGSVDVSEPTYFTYHNASDYVRIGSHVYTRDEVAQDLTLLAQVQPRYCVDERVNPPVLRPECLQPFLMDIAVAFDDLSTPLASVTALKHRHFVRIAYLTETDEDTSSTLKKSMSKRLKVHAQRHATLSKAQLLHDDPCFPKDAFNVTPRQAQVSMVTWLTFTAEIGELQPLRNLNGWYNTSCVFLGDGGAAGTPDDRDEVMKPLTPDTDEVDPVPMTIVSKYLGSAD